MLGAILGDIVGSPYEGGYKRSVDKKDFPLFSPDCRFTDDSVLTCATAKAIMHPSFASYSYRFAYQYKQWALRYPDRGYGSKFKEWIKANSYTINNSYANGCMMRCSPIALYYEDKDLALKRALNSIAYTHNSPESARGVQSIVDAIWMARHGASKEEIKTRVQEQYGHMLNLTLEELKTKWSRDIRSNLTAQQALICFMESNNYESAIRNAVYINGDTDTNAAIAGAISEAFYGVQTIPTIMIEQARKLLTKEMIDTVNAFYTKCGQDRFGVKFAL
jgi:ADP-ribosylglycohydrolase